MFDRWINLPENIAMLFITGNVHGRIGIKVLWKGIDKEKVSKEDYLVILSDRSFVGTIEILI